MLLFRTNDLCKYNICSENIIFPYATLVNLRPELIERENVEGNSGSYVASSGITIPELAASLNVNRSFD